MSEQLDSTNSFLDRIASRVGFYRRHYVESNVPTTINLIDIISIFGDIRTCCLFSTFIFRPVLEKNRDRYFVLCSWYDFYELFNKSNEFWCFCDDDVNSKLYSGAIDFDNDSVAYYNTKRRIIENTDAIFEIDFKKYYCGGFTAEYLKEFGGEIHCYLPNVPSSSMISGNFLNEINKDGKPVVFLFPVRRLWMWNKGRQSCISVNELFWHELIKYLLDFGLRPICYQNWATYDLSPVFLQDCVYLTPRSIGEIMAAMSVSHVVLDICSGIFTLSAISRSPCVLLDERFRYFYSGDFIWEYVFGDNSFHKSFIFSNMVANGSLRDWSEYIFPMVVRGVESVINIGRKNNNLSEYYYKISYDIVKDKQARRKGTVFINRHYKKIFRSNSKE